MENLHWVNLHWQVHSQQAKRSTMNTPAHLLIGAALFSKRDNTKLLTGALLGGFIPDVSLYLMAGISIFLLNISPRIVFGEMYFSNSWQLVFSSSALLHLVTDFALHHDDARAHFWPLSQWKFESPLSYWDSSHHSFYVIPVEGIVTAIATFYLVSGKLHHAIKAGLILLFIAELYTLSSWLRNF